MRHISDEHQNSRRENKALNLDCYKLLSIRERCGGKRKLGICLQDSTVVKTSQHIMRIFRTISIRRLAVLAFLMCIMVISLTLLKVFFPKQFLYADVFHIYRAIIEYQNFPMDTETIGEDNTTIIINIDKQTSNNNLKLGYVIDEKKYDNDPVLKHFMPPMKPNDRVDLLETLETFVRTCELHNLTYFLWAGSLLGAYRHHGLVPWDDDFDLVMNGSEWRKIRNVFSRVQGYGLLAERDNHWKFFKKDLPPLRGQFFKWPFIDIVFFTEDSTYVWALSKQIKTELVNRKEEIFPLQLHVFENLNVAVPCRMEEIVFRNFGLADCQSRTCSHRDSAALDSSRIKTIPCERLYNIFPFVFRHRDRVTGNIIEILKIGDRILRNISRPQSCIL